MWVYWIFFALESFFLNIMLPLDKLAYDESIYINLIIINSVILIFMIIMKYSHDKEFAKLLICALVFRLLFLFWSEYASAIFTLPNSGADEMTYYYNAMSNLVKGKEFTGYAAFFSWQARVFGLSKVYGKFVNVLFSISTITILRKILIRLNIVHSAKFKTLAVACFIPNYAILSALLLRESIIIFLVAVSVYFFVCWWKDSRIINVILSIGFSFIATWLHSGMIAFTLGLICVIVSAQRIMQGHQFKLFKPRTMVLSVLVIVIGLMILLNTDFGFTDYFRDADSLSDIVSISDAYEDGGSAYNANIVNNDSTIGFIINTPFRMLYFLFAPVPWDWRSASDIIAFLFSGLFYGYVFFASIYYVIKNKGSNLDTALLLISFFVVMMFGWGVSNSGTALRHRDKMVIVYLIMFAIMKNNKVLSSQGESSRRYYDEV